MKKPVFKTGNASIRAAINAVADFAEYHGVHIGGRPGWIQTTEGKHPPLVLGGTEAADEYWSLSKIPVDGGATKVAISNPGLVKKTTAYDNSDQVTIASIADEFTPTAGKLLCLKVVPDLTTTLVLVNEWTTWPNPLKTVASTPAGYYVFTEYYYVLYQFLASAGTNPYAIAVDTNLFAHKRCFNSNLLFTISRTEDADAHVVSFPELIPCLGAEYPA